MTFRMLIPTLALLAAAAALGAHPSYANKLVYHPLNPAFGGNPNNATFLFNNAALQNPFAASSGGSSTPSFDFGNGLGTSGPVIIINPSSSDITGPTVGVGAP